MGAIDDANDEIGERDGYGGDIFGSEESADRPFSPSAEARDEDRAKREMRLDRDAQAHREAREQSVGEHRLPPRRADHRGQRVRERKNRREMLALRYFVER